MRTGSGEGGVTVAIVRTSGEPGLDIIDPIERRRCVLRTDSPVSPTGIERDTFTFPVDTAVQITTGELRTDGTGHVYVRDGQGRMIAEVSNGVCRRFPRGQYSVEIAGLIKVYLRFFAEFEIEKSDDAPVLRLHEETTVEVGSRSLHTRPAETVTTTDDPVDLMRAISTFGSALKTTSPERSFPTLRGHPPAVELGECLEIPTGLTPPIDNVRIEVPPSLAYLFPIASLAYYLGVGIEPGDRARIIGQDFEYQLFEDNQFGREVREVLQRTFLLDCAVRTEGLYPVELHERRQLERRTNLDFGRLYAAQPAERLRTYLETPHDVVCDLIPQWRLAAHVEPILHNVETLPFLVNDLSVITIAEGEVVPASTITVPTGNAPTRGVASSSSEYVQPKGGADAMEQAWVSRGRPVDATKVIPEAYENRLGRTPDEGRIEIAVVCNDEGMAEERRIVDSVYGSREELPFGITVKNNLSRNELAELFATNYHFVHYIGHIDADGFRCRDGRLDAEAMEEVGPEAFFLNACQSYEQGLELIRGGAIGGIVTLEDVVDYGAVRIGRTVARLLNCGFPLRAAIDLARSESVMGSHYVVVGDGTLSIVQPVSGTSILFRLDERATGTRVTVDGYGSPPGMGCLYQPYVRRNERHHLAAGRSEPFDLPDDQLAAFLSLEEAPVIRDGRLTWTKDVASEV